LVNIIQKKGDLIMAEEMGMMGEQPPMESQMQMGMQEAGDKIMQSSKTVATILMTRLTNMSPEELQMLDKAITPDVAGVLIKLLPELQQIIETVESSGVADAMPEDQMMDDDDMPKDMGALGNM
tara:strand:- start:537 stop:908 length:372 start_codon:yes stop_codon:yes gene_type:complete